LRYIVFQICSRKKTTCSFSLREKSNTTKIPNWFEGTLKICHVSGFIPLAFRSLKSPNKKAPGTGMRRAQAIDTTKTASLKNHQKVGLVDL